jgi:hypothetical protein
MPTIHKRRLTDEEDAAAAAADDEIPPRKTQTTYNATIKRLITLAHFASSQHVRPTRHFQPNNVKWAGNVTLYTDDYCLELLIARGDE